MRGEDLLLLLLKIEVEPRNNDGATEGHDRNWEMELNMGI